MSRFAAHLATAIIAIAMVVTAVRPAAAGITGATLTAAFPTYTGSCPTTMTFSGEIMGTPGTLFQYSFNREINGSQVVQNATGTFVIPANGLLAVNDSFSISSTSTGVNFDQVWVHNIAGGQGDVYSPRAGFAVTCGSATPAPSASGSFRPAISSGKHTTTELVFGVPPPFNIASTTDPKVCGKHGGLAGVFCIQAVPDKYLILIWDWQANDRWPSIDGYHVYDVTNGAKTRVQDQTNPQATIEFFKPGSYTGKCYAVSAYKGANESSLSESFCTNVASVGLKTYTVTSVAAGSRFEEYNLNGQGAEGNCPEPCIGFFYHKLIVLGVVQDHWNLVQRGYMTFYPRGFVLRGLNVSKAILTVTRDRPGHPVPPDNAGNSFKCLGAIGATNADWVASTAFAAGDFGYDVPWTNNGETATFDVTRIVRDWATGARPNYGFVFKGKDENTGSDAADASCLLYLLPQATLTIDYYP